MYVAVIHEADTSYELVFCDKAELITYILNNHHNHLEYYHAQASDFV